MGMGQAHVAASEDVTATFYNPAALAQIRRIEVSTGFSHLIDNLDTVMFDQKSTSSLGSTKLSSIGLAYPFPTYRGSLVLAIAYNRTRNTDSDYLRASEVPGYFLGPPYGIVSGSEKESIFERGGISAWTAGLGTEISQEVSVGAAFSFLSGKSERQYEFSAQWNVEPPNTLYQHYLKSDDATITGWTASFGTLVKLGNVGRLGLTVRLPEYLTLDGQQTIDQYDQSINDYVTDEFSFEDKITLPITFMVGGSAALVPGLVLAADAKYTDWKQIDYAGPIRIDNLYAYRATTSLRFGAEYMFPFAPFRVRGGFFTEPVAFRLLPDITNSGSPMLASMDSDGKFYTAGAGYLFEETFDLDVAWVHGGYERSIPDYSEKKTTDKIFVTASYRF